MEENTGTKEVPEEVKQAIDQMDEESLKSLAGYIGSRFKSIETKGENESGYMDDDLMSELDEDEDFDIEPEEGPIDDGVDPAFDSNKRGYSI